MSGGPPRRAAGLHEGQAQPSLRSSPFISLPLKFFPPGFPTGQADGSGHAIRYWPREERWLIDLDGLQLRLHEGATLTDKNIFWSTGSRTVPLPTEMNFYRTMCMHVTHTQVFCCGSLGVIQRSAMLMRKQVVSCQKHRKASLTAYGDKTPAIAVWGPGSSKAQEQVRTCILATSTLLLGRKPRCI